jgi:hypothetical protein
VCELGLEIERSGDGRNGLNTVRACEGHAGPAHEDLRTADQRRADALVALAIRLADASPDKSQN